MTGALGSCCHAARPVAFTQLLKVPWKIICGTHRFVDLMSIYSSKGKMPRFIITITMRIIWIKVNSNVDKSYPFLHLNKIVRNNTMKHVELKQKRKTVHVIWMWFSMLDQDDIFISALWSESLCFHWQRTSGQDKLLGTHSSSNAFQCRQIPETLWAHKWSLHLVRQSNVRQENVVWKMTQVLANR